MPLRFTSPDRIVRATRAEFCALARTGYESFPPDRLVYDAESYEYDFCATPARDIERFTADARFGWGSTRDGIVLESTSFRDSCLARAERAQIERHEVPQIGKPSESIRKILGGSVVVDVPLTGTFAGMFTCCIECSIPECYSQYAWIESAVCVALWTINGGKLERVDCFPVRFCERQQR